MTGNCGKGPLPHGDSPRGIYDKYPSLDELEKNTISAMPVTRSLVSRISL